MRGRIALADRQYEQRLFRWRAILAAGLCLLLLLVLVIRMLYLQVVHHEKFSNLSLNNRLQVEPVPPTRGLIFDRNGVVLAENRPSYHLEIIREKVKDLDKTLAELVEVINVGPADIERFREALQRKRKFEPIALRVNLSEQEVAKFAVNRHRFPGVDINARLTRFYPHADLTAHVLGYVGRIDANDLKNRDKSNYRGTNYIGKLGIERTYEQYLHGQVGYRQLEVNVQGRELREIGQEAARPGANIRLHLDIKLQQVAKKALGDNHGAVLAMNPNNGAMHVFVSEPSYKPHVFVNGISRANYRKLQQHAERPLFNRALQGQYPPGSTLKPFLGLGALETSYQTESQKIKCKGFYKLPTDDRKYRDWKRHGHGSVNLKKAIVESCDVFFYDLAYRMGIDAMVKYLAHYGLGKATGIDLPGERSGLLPTREWKRKRFNNMPWFPGETLIAGIGQGYMLMTPLQLVQAVAGLATGGIRQPRLLAAVEGEEQPPLQTIASIPVQKPENWQAIRQAMRDVVHTVKGTAYSAALGVSYEFAGKTGTSQVISIAQDEEYDETKLAKQHHDHALFIAYAPIEEPQLAVAVLVEHGGGGGAVAAPIARKVFDAYFRQQNAKK